MYDVLTPFGWVGIDRISIGSQVIVEDDVKQPELSASIANVIDKDILTGELYHLELSDGTSIILHEDIALSARLGKQGDWSIIKVRDMLTWTLIPSQGTPCACPCDPLINGLYNIRPILYYIPFIHRTLIEPPPYWLGVLASIGCLERSPYTIIEPYVYLDREGAQRMRDQDIWTMGLIDPPILSIDPKQELEYKFWSKDIDQGRSKLSRELKNLEILGLPPRDRFIHPSYKHTRFDHRVQLIQGIMDSIGYIDPIDHHTKARCLSKQLAYDLVYILRTLGGYGYITPLPNLRQWIVTVFMPDPEYPFSRPSKLKHWVRKPFNIEPLTILNIKLLGTSNYPIIKTDIGQAPITNNLIPRYLI